MQQARALLPTLHINFRLGHYCDIKEWLKKGVIDFGILLDNDDLSLFDCTPIRQGYFRLYASKACKDFETLGFLLDSDERKETNVVRQRYWEKYGKELPLAMEISSWEVIANLTTAGLGIGLFPDYVAEKRESQLQVVFPDLANIPYTLFMIFKKNKPLPSHVLRFCEVIKQEDGDHKQFLSDSVGSSSSSILSLSRRQNG